MTTKPAPNRGAGFGPGHSRVLHFQLSRTIHSSLKARCRGVPRAPSQSMGHSIRSARAGSLSLGRQRIQERHHFELSSLAGNI
jgi:hypothetical protein